MNHVFMYLLQNLIWFRQQSNKYNPTILPTLEMIEVPNSERSIRAEVVLMNCDEEDRKKRNLIKEIQGLSFSYKVLPNQAQLSIT